MASRLGPLRRLYDWTLSWADHPSAARALFLLAFAESSFFPVPPDVLLIALAAGRPDLWLRWASICSVGSVAGGVAGYAIGALAWEAVRDLFIPYVFSQSVFDLVARYYERDAFLYILLAAFTPIPYKVFTVAAGVFHERVGLGTLVWASAIGRPVRFFLVAGILRVFGPAVKAYIDRYFDAAAMAFGVLLVLGFLAVRYL